MVGEKFHLTMTLLPEGVEWRLWRGITETYDPIDSGLAHTWQAATQQAGNVLARLAKHQAD